MSPSPPFAGATPLLGLVPAFGLTLLDEAIKVFTLSFELALVLTLDVDWLVDEFDGPEDPAGLASELVELFVVAEA